MDKTTRPVGKTTRILKHEFFTTVRRPGFLVMTALFPTLAVLLVVGAFVYNSIRSEKAPEARVVGYVDPTGLFTRFTDREGVTFQRFNDQAAGVQALISDDVKALYVLAPEYLSTGVVAQVKLHEPGIPFDGSGEGPLELREFILDNLLADNLSADQQERVRTPVRMALVQVDGGGQVIPETFDVGKFLFFISLGILVIMSVYMSSGFLQQGLSEEKENRIMEVLLSSVTSSQLMLGKLLGLGAAGLLQMVVWVASAAIIIAGLKSTNVDVPPISVPSPMLVVAGTLYFLLGYALSGALMAALGAITTTYREAQQYTMIVVMPSISIFWFLTPILQDPDGPVARFYSFFPLTASTGALVRLALGAMSTPDLLVSLGILAISVVLVMVLTLRLFKTFLLMYGQRPSVGSVIRAVVKG